MHWGDKITIFLFLLGTTKMEESVANIKERITNYLYDILQIPIVNRESRKLLCCGHWIECSFKIQSQNRTKSFVNNILRHRISPNLRLLNNSRYFAFYVLIKPNIKPRLWKTCKILLRKRATTKSHLWLRIGSRQTIDVVNIV